MLKRDELKGPSCLTSAADDEPIFVLKSTDELAPEIVREWASRYKASKQAQVGGWTQRQQAKHEEACLLATKMLRWQQERMAQQEQQHYDEHAPTAISQL